MSAAVDLLAELRALAVLWKSRILETQHHDLPDACEGKTAPEGYESGLGQCLADLTAVIGPTVAGPCRRCAREAEPKKKPMCPECGDAKVVCCPPEEATEQMAYGIGPVKDCPACVGKP